MTSRDPVLFQHFKGHSGTILGLAYNPKDGRLVSCSTDKTVMVWQVRITQIIALLSLPSDAHLDQSLSCRTRSPSAPFSSTVTSAR